MPAIVADTGPLNYLVRIGHVDILKPLFGTVCVPEAVIAELRHEMAPELVRTLALQPPD
jgi:predicted nucleic acid-binding protein